MYEIVRNSFVMDELDSNCRGRNCAGEKKGLQLLHGATNHIKTIGFT